MTVQPTDEFPFIESRALKNKLEGLLVSASTYGGTSREVPVRFVSPDFELAQAVYPGVYITYGAVSKADDREHRGPTLLGYAPPGFDTDVQVPANMADKDSTETVSFAESGFDKESSPYYVADTPIPYNLDFNIGVLTRNYQQAFELIAQLQKINRIPERFGYLEVPEDGTIRTLELVGGPETSVETDEDGKRLVQTLYSVRVAAELTLFQVEQVRRVAEVRPTIHTTGSYL